MMRKKINVSTVLAGQRLGIKEVDDGIWLLSFMHYDLGYIDLEQRTLQTIDNPFGTRLSPMSQGQTVTHLSGPDKVKLVAGTRNRLALASGKQNGRPDDRTAALIQQVKLVAGAGFEPATFRL